MKRPRPLRRLRLTSTGSPAAALSADLPPAIEAVPPGVPQWHDRSATYSLWQMTASGATVAAAATFLPCYLFTVLPAPLLRRYARLPALTAAVQGITVAAVGPSQAP